MKIIITESQYKKLISESFPEGIELSIGDKINKSIIKIFQWCHKNIKTKIRFYKNDVIKNNDHPVIQLKKNISKKLAIDDSSALVIAWSFYLRYNPEGNYEQYLNEDLDFLGDFKFKTTVNVKSTQYGTVDGDYFVYASGYDDVADKIKNGDYYNNELYYDTLEQDGWRSSEWEVVVDGAVVDNYNDIEFIGD